MNSIIHSKTLPLTMGAFLRFMLALVISKKMLATDAAFFFIAVSVSPIIFLIARGQLAAAKSRAVELTISTVQFDYIHKKVIQKLLFLLFSILIMIWLVSQNLFENIKPIILGLLLGGLYLFHNVNQMAFEVRKNGLRYYWVINVQIITIITFFNFFVVDTEILFFILCIVLIFDTVYSYRVGEQFDANIIKSFKFAKIEATTIFISAIELPVILLVGGSNQVVDYAILSRMFNSLVTVYGQITRTIWANGELAIFQFYSIKRTININISFYFVFIFIVLMVPFVDILFIKTSASFLWTVFLLIAALIQVSNRFFKNKYLNQSRFEVVGTKVLTYYWFYLFILLMIAALELPVEVFLLAKLMLVISILFENLRELRNVN